MSYIAFNDKIPYPMLYAREDPMYTTSYADVDQSGDRKVLAIHFDPKLVKSEDLKKYYVNAAEETSVITIVDDAGKPFIHTDYCIPIRLGEEMVPDDTNSHIVLALARLTTKDKLLREIAGKQKVYTGSPLEIMIEKKVDEMSAACTQNIYDGIDIPLSNGEVRHYTFDSKDQTDITGLVFEMLIGSKLLIWHDDIEEEDCEILSKENLAIISNVLSLHRKYNISYFRNLRRYIRSFNGLDDIPLRMNAVDAIWYGIELPDEFKSDTFKTIIEEMGGIIEYEKATMQQPPDYTELNQTIIDQQEKYAIENGLIPESDTGVVTNNEGEETKEE